MKPLAIAALAILAAACSARLSVEIDDADCNSVPARAIDAGADPCGALVEVQCPPGTSPGLAPDAGPLTCSDRGGGLFCCSGPAPCM